MVDKLSRADLRLVFRAAFSRGEEARDAWEAFRGSREIDDLYLGAPEIMPALYLNLERESLRGDWLEKIKGVYRYTWCRNQLAIRKLATLLERLSAAGIRPIAVGGLGVLLAIGLTRAERPLLSLELLVPADHWTEAGRICAELAGLFGEPEKDPMPALSRSPWIGSEREWRSGAVAAPIAQSSILVPRPEDLLLEACVRGRKTRDGAWLVDAALLLSVRGNIMDWNAFEAMLGPRMAILPVRRSLAVLSDIRPGLVPERVNAGIARLRPHPFERLPPALASIARRSVSPLRRALALRKRRRAGP